MILSSDVQVSEDGQLIDTVVDDKVSIEEDYAEQDERERLRTIIRSLEPEERELLNVMYLSGRVRTEQETANGACRIREHELKKTIRKLFTKISKKLFCRFWPPVCQLRNLRLGEDVLLVAVVADCLHLLPLVA